MKIDGYHFGKSMAYLQINLSLKTPSWDFTQAKYGKRKNSNNFRVMILESQIFMRHILLG